LFWFIGKKRREGLEVARGRNLKVTILNPHRFSIFNNITNSSPCLYRPYISVFELHGMS